MIEKPLKVKLVILILGSTLVRINMIKRIISAENSPNVIMLRGSVITFKTGFMITNPIVRSSAAYNKPGNPPLITRPEKI